MEVGGKERASSPNIDNVFKLKAIYDAIMRYICHGEYVVELIFSRICSPLWIQNIIKGENWKHCQDESIAGKRRAQVSKLHCIMAAKQMLREPKEHGCDFDLKGGEEGAELGSVEAALDCALFPGDAGAKLVEDPLDQLPGVQMKGRSR